MQRSLCLLAALVASGHCLYWDRVVYLLIRRIAIISYSLRCVFALVFLQMSISIVIPLNDPLPSLLDNICMERIVIVVA